MNSYRALVVNKSTEDEGTEISIQPVERKPLADNELFIDVHYSSINYKDGMVSALGQIATTFPITPGIDLAGVVKESNDDRFKVGDEVIATSYDIGTSIDGGYQEYATLPGEYVIPLPDGLSLREAMIQGTAGLTVGIAIDKLEKVGVHPDNGDVLVAGASGGSGSLAVRMLNHLGYDVVASSGSSSREDYLKSIGAKKVIARSEVENTQEGPVNQPLYQAAIDPVGGSTTEYILKTLEPEGAVVTYGLVGGIDVSTTVLPFIGRGIHWMGADSVYFPMAKRQHIWKRLATDLNIDLESEGLVNEIGLDDLPQALHDIIDGNLQGRTIVNLKS
ncbi:MULTISPECIES: acryloyl-CoA reductase [unclassified Jeotgalicoccus]|uniref:acrylyl-CoA reductase family protein n=1 Tax=unclassified Jeotgalicoccus TaxID=2630462 RepID=UPI00141524C3|nr:MULTISPECIES: acryloyl-CoA reductase [unclassified Jeotgalicoccus]QQD84586.1 acryloyl-CoA reductase [Jeotgalicoccus sp. ATCC 8456]